MNIFRNLARARQRISSRDAVVGVAAAAALALSASAVAGSLQEQTYEPTDAELTNPERGLYVQFTAREDAVPLDVAELRKLRDDHITLTLRLYYLKEFRGRPIDQARLDLVRSDLQKIREAGVKCILRFAYNEAIGEDDASIDIVMKHMAQLRPILRENADVIAVVQAGFVGSWGEWHASTNDLRKPANAKRIVGAWLKTLPESRFVQVRTPVIKSIIVDDLEPLSARETLSGTSRSRIAHHNDCFLATFNDMGTYENIEAEKNYLALETVTLPMGGETCHVSEFNAVDNARSEFERFHWSYLNLGYHPEVIQQWRDEGFFDEVRRKLGYRLVLEEARVTDAATPGGDVELQLDLRNHGWAAPFNPRDVEVIFKSDAGEYAVVLDVDPRSWLPGEAIEVRDTISLPRAMAAGEYQLLLAFPDPEPALHANPNYAIELANDGLWDATTGRHDLKLTVNVTPAASR